MLMSHYDSQKVGRVLIVSRDLAASRQISKAMQEDGLSVEAAVDLSVARGCGDLLRFRDESFHPLNQ
jgi:hypothetical protein